MQNNEVFNITVCIVGILILLVHIVNLIIKKDRRKDENSLLSFLIFTALHFLIYLIYTLIHVNYSGDLFVKLSYTTFYIFNNLELFLLLIYTLRFISLPNNIKNKYHLINVSLFSIIIILDIINIFTGIFFYVENGIYVRSKTMIFSQSYQFIIFVTIFFTILLNKKLNLREKISFAIYCILPFVSILLQNKFKGYAIAYLSIIISVEILFFFINVQKNIDLAKEEERNRDAQVKLMLSQIQPHFIYNSLSSISTLIEIDPLRAQKALDDFTDYLRMNLSSITETKLIPFEYELKHIRTYIDLEKIRFNDRINVIFDIKAQDFSVSPLSIQPIVENAIKHGILKKIEGGTIIIKTYEDDKTINVEIIDDGVGFNMEDVDFNNNHFGLNNIKYRIEKTNGTFNINSKPGIGTNVKVSFNK